MKKYNQFEIFRFIGAFTVLIFHTAKNTSFYSQVPSLFQNGITWVHFFFLLSGFLLSYSYNNKEINIKKFYLTRLFKFYPLYIFTLLLFLKYKGKLIYNIFLLQSWIFGKALIFNGPTWYLSTLISLLILFPALLSFQKKHPKFFLYFVIITNIYTYYAFLTFVRYSDNISIHHLINYSPIFHISSFVLGMGVYSQIKNFKKKKYYSIFIILYFSFLILFVQYNKIIPYFSSLVAFSFTPLIMFLFLDSGVISQMLGNSFFIYLGNLSFSLYVLHNPIFLLYEKFVHEIDSNYHFILFFIILFVISNLTKYFIENKCYKFLCSKYLKPF